MKQHQCQVFGSICLKSASFVRGCYHALTLFARWPLWPSVVQEAQTYCRRRPCDCGDPDEDLFCCPGCDNRPNSQCLDQSGRTLYRSGASWLYGCQQCRCMVSRHVHLHVPTCVLPAAMKADLHLESLSVGKQVTSQKTQNVLINLKLRAVFCFVFFFQHLSLISCSAACGCSN